MAQTRAKRKPTVTDADLRAELASWSRADLEDFALDMLRENRAAHEAVARQAVAKRGSAAAVAVFMTQIDAALDVGFVGWKEIRDYSRRLDGIVADVRKLGKADPRSACEVARYFLAGLPAVFESVDAENEIADVCEELAEILLALARPSGAGLLSIFSCFDPPFSKVWPPSLGQPRGPTSWAPSLTSWTSSQRSLPSFWP